MTRLLVGFSFGIGAGETRERRKDLVEAALRQQVRRTLWGRLICSFLFFCLLFFFVIFKLFFVRCQPYGRRAGALTAFGLQ